MKRIVSIFENQGYIVKTFDKSSDIIEELLRDVLEEESVGFGGSSTINELGIYEELENRGNKVYWHWKSSNKEDALSKARNADIYMASVNAITEDGKILNMDGTANRIPSMIFGHKKVILIIGKNKICKDYEAARDRIRNIAAPKNAVRLNLRTPCAITGKCNDCDSPQRMCKVESIFHRKPGGSSIYLYLVDEELGY